MLAVCFAGLGCAASPDSRGLVDDLPRHATTLVVDLGEIDDPVLAFSRIADVAQDRSGVCRQKAAPLTRRAISSIRGDRLYGVWRDELRVETVRVYRIDME